MPAMLIFNMNRMSAKGIQYGYNELNPHPDCIYTSRLVT